MADNDTRGSITMRELMPSVIDMIENGRTVSLTVKGVSMKPLLVNGRDEILMVSPAGRVPKVGDLYMFRRDDGSYAMHRICAIDADGSIGFVGDNQLTVEKGMTRDSLVAYVPAVIRKGRFIDCEKGLLRAIMILRMKLRVANPDLVMRAAALKHKAEAVIGRISHNAGDNGGNNE